MNRFMVLHVRHFKWLYQKISAISFHQEYDFESLRRSFQGHFAEVYENEFKSEFQKAGNNLRNTV